MKRSPDYIESTATLLRAVRTAQPLVQCITNTVVSPLTANVLLALGVSPAMVDIPAEAGPFAEIASGLLINTGTPHVEQRLAMSEATIAAYATKTPWVLDPVAVGFLPVRTTLVHDLLAQHPTIIRGNPSEIIALAHNGPGPRGVDSTDTSENAAHAATQLAQTHKTIVAVSGPTDIVTNGHTLVRISNGHPWLTRMTGGGCALGAVMAAFASVHDDRFDATIAACTVYAIAAEKAAENASGPGSFAVNFLDNLETVTEDDVRERAVVA